MSSDGPLAEAVAAGLGTRNDDVAVEGDIDAALALVEGRQFAAAILDYDRERPDGRRFLETYREFDPLLPVVVITRQPSYEDAVAFLRGGSAALALDYRVIRMPDMDLLARIREVIEGSLLTMKAGDFVVDRRMRWVYYGDRDILLTPAETQVFMAFMTRPHQPLSYEDLYHILEGRRADDAEEARSRMRSHVSRIRAKTKQVVGREVIERMPGEPVFIFEPIPERERG